MFEIIKALTFAALLSNLGGVPLEMGVDVWRVSQHHGLSAATTGGLLLAENGGSPPYDPLEIGRFRCQGGACEAGLLQLKRVWSAEATERCNALERAGHHRYDGLPDCLWIKPGQRVWYRVRRAPDWRDGVRHLAGARTDERTDRTDLFEARTNLEAGVIAYLYLQDRWRTHHDFLPHWLVLFRCSGANHHRTPSSACLQSVKRAHQSQGRVLRLMRSAGL